MMNRRSALCNGLLGAAAAASVGITGTAEAAARRPRQYTLTSSSSAQDARAWRPPSKRPIRAPEWRFWKR